MIVHFCDICGAELSENMLIDVNVKIGSGTCPTNIDVELCTKCKDEVISLLQKTKKTVKFLTLRKNSGE